MAQMMAGRGRLHGIDALRGIAATAVVFHHVIWLLGLKIEPFMQPAAAYFGLGVPLFFIISAIAMFHTYDGRMIEPGAEQRFFIKRYFRLLPLMVAVYLAYNGFLYGLYGAGFANLTSVRVFADVSLLFALIPQASAGPVPAAWSIGVEMLFYILVPLALRLCADIRVAFALLALAYAVSWDFQASLDPAKLPNQWYTAINPVLFIPCFLIGIAIQRLHSSTLAARATPMAGNIAIIASLVVLVMLITQTSALQTTNAGTSYWMKVHVFSLFFAIVVFFTTYAPSKVISNRATRFLGDLSYGIYLIHPPVIVLIVKPLLPELRVVAASDDGLLFILCSAATLAVTIILAWVAHLTIEKPGIALGNRLAAKVGRAAPHT
jgi:peptidoglycan/LPS O-acetylase OafA/YrhL